MPENTPVFLDGVECSGTETQLSDCMNTTTTSQCSSAGVTCEKSSSKFNVTSNYMHRYSYSSITGTERCVDAAGTPPQSLNLASDYERYAYIS